MREQFPTAKATLWATESVFTKDSPTPLKAGLVTVLGEGPLAVSVTVRDFGPAAPADVTTTTASGQIRKSLTTLSQLRTPQYCPTLSRPSNERGGTRRTSLTCRDRNASGVIPEHWPKSACSSLPALPSPNRPSHKRLDGVDHEASQVETEKADE